MTDWQQCPAVERNDGRVSGAWTFVGARSLGRLRMTDADLGQPHRPLVIVDAVPDPARSRDLVLPLLQTRGVHEVEALGTLEGVLPPAAPTRLGAQRLPRRPGARRGNAAEFFPLLGRGVVGEAEIPAAGARRRCNAVTATRHRR